MKNFTIVKIFICVILAAFVNAGYSQINVKGKVTDLDGNTLPGVNIVVKGSTAGTITDAGGLYSIEALAEDILVFSFIGYNSEEIPVGNKTTIDVMMVEDITSLEEVVVIGYGTSNKKDLVSSVSSIKSDVLENVPSIRVDQALQGRATGVEVTSNNGAPGAGTTIRIRGNSSINGNNDPLYVVDGFIAGTGFNLNNLNVNDIESVEVLKDATALSIYGTRGAAGVILITTKDGSRAVQGKPTISVNYYTTTQSIANEIDLLGGEDYINYINEAAQFVPGPNVTVNDVDLPLGLTDTSLPLIYDNPSETPTTDWLDLVNQRGSIMNADVSITGNGDKSNYYVSMNYFDQKGIIRGSGIERFVLRTNLDIKPSDKFKTGIRFNLSNFRREVNKINFQEIVNGVHSRIDTTQNSKNQS